MSTYTADPLTAADELITLGNRAFDEERDPAPYYDRAKALLDACESGDGDLAATLRDETIAWLTR